MGSSQRRVLKNPMVSDPFPKSSLQLKRYTMVYPISDTPIAKFLFRDGNNHPDLAIKTHPGHANSWDKSAVDKFI